MSVALLYPEPEKGGRAMEVLRGEGVSDSNSLSKASTVLRYSADLSAPFDLSVPYGTMEPSNPQIRNDRFTRAP
jgi:hypothetical protein